MNTINSLVGNNRLGFEDAYWTTGSGFMNDIYTRIHRRAGGKIMLSEVKWDIFVSWIDSRASGSLFTGILFYFSPFLPTLPLFPGKLSARIFLWHEMTNPEVQTRP